MGQKWVSLKVEELAPKTQPEKIKHSSAADNDSETKMTFLRRQVVKMVSKIGKTNKHTTYASRTHESRRKDSWVPVSPEWVPTVLIAFAIASPTRKNCRRVSGR